MRTVEPFQEQVSKALFDVGEDGGGGLGQGEKLSLESENPFGDEAMNVGVEVRSKRAEGLDGAHAAGPNVITLEELLETLADALVGGLREKGEQAAFALEKSSEGLRDCKGVVSMRDRL